jgi:tRNA threonylcarbamoyl adenosine modification protein YeaZ
VLLAIDTSAGTSVAIVDRDAGVLFERSSADTRKHAEAIGSFIEECLNGARVTVTDLSGVAVGMGPGPFTGLRVGIAAARAFAFGAGKTVVPVVSHDAIAFGVKEPMLVVADARRREVYWSAYSGMDEVGLPVRVHGPALSRPEDLGSAVPEYAAFHRHDSIEVSAGSLGMVAELLLTSGKPFATSEPLYLRSPDITISAGPKRVSS